MSSQPITKNRLKNIIDLFLNCPIAVYGDFLADEYIFGEFSRVSREAPVLILEYKESQILPGGAANTVNNLRKLGASPIPIGALGNDAGGKDVFLHVTALEQAGIDTLEEGDAVSFEIGETRGKDTAINVKKI